MHHNPKIRAYDCGIKHLGKIKILSQSDIAANRVKFYTDSQIVLHYLQNKSKEHPVFISNHLKEIQLNSKFSEWNLVPGNKSPADLCTWLSHIKQITKNSIRANDPTFLESFIPIETVLIENWELTCNVSSSAKNKRFKFCFNILNIPVY